MNIFNSCYGISTLYLENSLCFGLLVFKIDSRLRKIDSILSNVKTFSFVLYNEANSTIIDSTHKTVIKAEKLCVNYTNGKTVNKALQDVDLEIKENEFTLIIGSSGSGKSTLLNAIGGMLKPTNGDIYYKDENISKMNDNSRSDYRKDIVGFIFQQYNLLSDLTVKENIELASSLVKDSFKVEEVLNIKNGETTSDNKFTLTTLRCVGACALAPVMQINGKTYGNVKPDEVINILAEYM